MSDQATMLGHIVPPFIDWKGKRYELRFKVQRVQAHFQNAIKAKRRKEAAEMADSLPEDQRLSYLMEVTKSMNKPNAVTDQDVAEFMGSQEGIYENVRAFVIGMEKADDETILNFLADCATEFEIALQTVTTSLENSLSRTQGKDPKAKLTQFQNDGIV